MSKIYPEPNTGCWLWGGMFDCNGYGRGKFPGKIQLAHRYLFFLYNPDSDKSKHVLHKCDNPACVNPCHLYLGDQRQNNIDRDLRGRQKTKRGEEHKVSKLKEDNVFDIRRLYSTGLVSQRLLARMYGVDQARIKEIVKNRAWRHLLP